ncbi:hypothetical protein OBBRIDRAFT_471472 [Obba rivulosa]|uniref:N-acetyltransferase domain-containing protein n=1 Tax=Obba rivulosa TaxID=1052685 RepID=A0A8E2DN66_9APHY|nr:hypothetical protein OBBRIDRAFT_471472 [Obba rivulosa]
MSRRVQKRNFWEWPMIGTPLALLKSLRLKDVNRSRKPMGVEPLTYGQIPKATRSVRDAFRDDPVESYILNTPDSHEALTRGLYTLWNVVGLATSARKKHAFTVNDGDAVVSYDPASANKDTRSLFERILDVVTKSIIRVLQVLDSPEQSRRKKEYRFKEEIAIKDAIGDRIKEIITLRGLATAPAKRRRGYGSMLMKAVTSIADVQGRSTMLISSNVDNTAFYESHGFRVVIEFTIGEHNPTWEGDPLIVRVMVRPPA